MKHLAIVLLYIITLVSCNNSSEKATALLNEGDQLYKEGYYAEALEKFNQARQLDPSVPNLEYNTGCAYFSLEKYDTAIMYFDKAIAADNFPQAYFFKAQALANLEKPEEAFVSLMNGFQRDSTQEEAYFVKGLILFQLERYPEAITAHTRFLQKYPNDKGGYIKRCAAYAMNDEVDKALADAKKVIALDSNDAEGYELKALVLYEMQENDSACLFWNKAKQIDPSLMNETLEGICN